MFRRRSFIGTRQELAGLLPGSSKTATDGFDIQVGRSAESQTTHIPQCVLTLCPILNGVLKPGCRVVNADPVVFAIIIQHLRTISVFGFMSINAPGHLPELTVGDEALLNFAKAWHILDMLRKPALQDKLIKVYRKYYLKRLEDGRQHQELEPLALKPLESEPFVYLRDNVGNHSKAEKFLIDFHAGLMQTQTELNDDNFKLLPPEITLLIRDRWLELCGRVRKDSHQSDSDHDRIVASDPCYKITKNEAIRHTCLQIQYLCGGTRGTFGLNPPLSSSTRANSNASHSNLNRHHNRLETLTERRNKPNRSSASTETEPPRSGSPRPLNSPLGSNPSNPFEAPPTRRKQRTNSSPISPAQLPGSHNPSAATRRSSPALRSAQRRSRDQAPRRSSVSFAIDAPSRAPLASGNPGRGSWSRDIRDAEPVEGESERNVFASGLRWDELPADQTGEFGAFSVLDFAA